jgi:membrane-bound lytic murein transglycosylase D
MDHPAKYDSVTITYPVDLRLVAECVGATTVELQELNPSLLRLTTPREGKFELHLPAGKKDEYQTAIAAIPTGMRLSWRYHTVQSGDTLASLAKSYRAPAKSIAEVNHVDGTDLETGAKLVIPVAPGKHPISDTATYARRITRYRVHKGDSVETVAENFGVSPQMLRRWNGLRGDSLRGRKVLALHLPVSPSPRDTEVASSRSSKSSRHGTRGSPAVTDKSTANSAKTADTNANSEEASVIRHRVKYGETLYSIATSYKTTVAALKRDNSNVAVLRPGMILVVQSAR